MVGDANDGRSRTGHDPRFVALIFGLTEGLMPSTCEGSATPLAAAASSSSARSLQPTAGQIGLLSAKDGPPLATGAKPMSLNDASAVANSLAATLMVAIIIFRAGDGTLSVTPCNEFGGEAAIVAESDPFDAERVA